MSYTLGQLVSCPNLQRKITDRFVDYQVNEFMPFFEFLTSPINNKGLSQDVAPGGGKTRIVTLTYTPRRTEAQLSENVANPKCDVSNFIGNRYQNYEIDTEENIADGFSISRLELERACESNEMYVADRIMDMIDVVDRGLATKHSNDLMANIGKWATNVAVNASNEFEVKTLQTGSSMIDPQTHAKINFALAKNGMSRNSYIFAGNTLAEYYRATLAGCCSEQGIDIASILRQYGVGVAYDMRIEDALGDANKAVAVQAGAVTLLTYTASSWRTGMNRVVVDGANYVQYVVTSPRTGVAMDLTVADNCGQISFSLVATTKLATLPMDLYQEGDRMLGVNYVAKIKVVNS